MALRPAVHNMLQFVLRCAGYSASGLIWEASPHFTFSFKGSFFMAYIQLLLTAFSLASTA